MTLNAGNSEGSTGIASGDFDGDGDEDLLVTNIAAKRSCSIVTTGTASSRMRGGHGYCCGDEAFTGFGTEWIDWDNDGRLDLFAANVALNTIAARRGTAVVEWPGGWSGGEHGPRSTNRCRDFSQVSGAARWRRAREPMTNRYSCTVSGRSHLAERRSENLGKLSYWLELQQR